MNLILHQFKTDVRHFRLELLVLWGTFGLQWWLGSHQNYSDDRDGFLVLVQILQLGLTLFLVARAVQADALEGTSASWLTRPVRRRHLFWSKTSLLLLLVAVPCILVTVLTAAGQGFPPDLLLAQTEEFALYTLAIVFVIAALAALTRDLTQFFLMLGLLAGALFLWSALISLDHRRDVSMNSAAGLRASIRVMFFGFLTLCAIAGWVMQVLGGWRASGFILLTIGLLSIPNFGWSWRTNFFPGISRSMSPLPVVFADAPLPAGVDDSVIRQHLSTELCVDRVPADSFLMMASVMGSFQPDGQPSLPRPVYFNYRNSLFPPTNTGAGWNYWDESPQQGNYVVALRRQFPAETIWLGPPPPQSGENVAYLNRLQDEFNNKTLAGSLSLDLKLHEFKIVPAARVPVKPVTIQVAPGQRISLRRIYSDTAGIHLVVDEAEADPRFRRDNYPGFHTKTAFGGNLGLGYYVLYHPRFGEAFTGSANYGSGAPDLTGGQTLRQFDYIFPFPALRERLTGVSLAEWLKEAQFCVFVPKYQGSFDQHLERHVADVAGFSRKVFGPRPEDAARLVKLPPAATETQVNQYVETILQDLPDNWNLAGKKNIQDELALIGTGGLPVLLRHLPLSEEAEDNYVLPVLTRLATHAQLPELLAALDRDPNLAGWFEQKGWAAEARPTLLARLPEHRLNYPAAAVKLVAEAHDPATYEDIKWRFLQLRDGQDRVLPALRACPGFDVAGAVREAWRLAQLGLVGNQDLTLAAAELGLTDAFQASVMNMESLPDQYSRVRLAAKLVALTQYPGSTSQAAQWLSANLGRFDFDAALGRYVVRN